MVLRSSILRPGLNLRYHALPTPRFRPSAIASKPFLPAGHYARSYARYSRFGDDEGKGQSDGKPNSDENFKRKYELYQLYGSAALVGGAGTIWYVSQ